MVYILMCVGAMFLAGSSVVVGKMLVVTLPVFITTFGSLLVAFICMLPLMRGKFHELAGLDRRQWIYLFLQGLCGIVLFRVFTLYGLQYTSAVQAGLITGTTPAVLALLSLILLRERMSVQGLAGVVLGVAGASIILVYSVHSGGKSSLAGGMLVGFAVICEALFTIFRKRVADSVSAVTNTTVLIFCSLVIIAPLAAIELWGPSVVIDTRSVLGILYYGVFATVIAYLLWTGAVGRVSGAAAGAATAVMPASSVLLAGIVLGEEILPAHFIGCVFIVAGILVSSCNLQILQIIPAAGRRNR